MYDLLKNKKELETKLIESPVRSAKRVSGLPQKQIELEDRLFRWIGLNERRGLLLDGVKICKQAQNLANELNFSSGLQFTEGWLRGFKKRYDLHRRVAHGEKQSADEISAELGQRSVASFNENDDFNDFTMNKGFIQYSVTFSDT